MASLAGRARALPGSRRAAFTGTPVARPRPLCVAAGRHAGRRQASAAPVQALLRQWPDKDFIKEVKAAFPDQGVATVEEARVLFSELGYTYLDVRPELECEEVGKVKGSVNVPLYNSARKWNAAEGKKTIVKEKNPDFLRLIEKKFPDKSKAKLLVACSDGRAYSIEALEELDGAGYENLAGLRGGFYAWFRVFDNKLGRRRYGEYAENYSHDGDSCGIHSSGAGFEKMDPQDSWVPPSY